MVPPRIDPIDFISARSCTSKSNFSVETRRSGWNNVGSGSKKELEKHRLLSTDAADVRNEGREAITWNDLVVDCRLTTADTTFLGNFMLRCQFLWSGLFDWQWRRTQVQWKKKTRKKKFFFIMKKLKTRNQYSTGTVCIICQIYLTYVRMCYTSTKFSTGMVHFYKFFFSN